MYLKDGKVVLRTAVNADADILLRWWNDGAVMAHAGFPQGLHTTKEKVLDNIAWRDEGRELIMLEFEGVPIGELNYRPAKCGAPEIGIKICEADMREQGIGTRALRLLICFLFEVKKYPKILVSTNLDNERAQHVYEKAGFKKIGISHNSWTDETGKQHSEVNYEFTRDNFTARKKELCGKVFASFAPVLEQYNIKLGLNIAESGKTLCAVENGVLTVNVTELAETEFEAFIAYEIQKLILPVLRLETDRLIVRRLEERDLADFFEIASSEEIVVMDGSEAYRDIEEFKPVFEGFLTDKYRYAAVLKSENKLVGIINFRTVDWRAVTAFEIGYDVNKEYQRRGLAFEFVGAFIRFCLDKLRVDLITAGCFENNEPSINLLRKLGFVYEGKLRKALQHGRWAARDLHSFCLEKGEGHT